MSLFFAKKTAKKTALYTIVLTNRDITVILKDSDRIIWNRRTTMSKKLITALLTVLTVMILTGCSNNKKAVSEAAEGW